MYKRQVVDDPDAALGHVRRHGSGHTEAIVTEDRAAARSSVTIASVCPLPWRRTCPSAASGSSTTCLLYTSDAADE